MKDPMTAETTTIETAKPAALPADALIILPVRNMVLFPGLIAPLALGRQETIAGAQEAARSQRQVGIVLQRAPEIEAPAASDLHNIGTTAAILRYITTPDGAHNLVLQGEQRFRVKEYLDGYPFRVARVDFLPDSQVLNRDLEARMLQVKQRANELLELLPRAP